jgi:hypothetical protein
MHNQDDEKAYVMSSNEDVEMRDVEDEDSEEEVQSELDPDEGAYIVSSIILVVTVCHCREK